MAVFSFMSPSGWDEWMRLGVGGCIALLAGVAGYILAKKGASRQARQQALLVEDSALSAQPVIKELEKAGYHVLWRERAEVALRESGPFSLLVVDFELPTQSGCALIAAVRAGESSLQHDTPAVILTAHSPVMLEKECRKAGASAVIAKPLTAAKLAKVQKYVEQKRFCIIEGPERELEKMVLDVQGTLDSLELSTAEYNELLTLYCGGFGTHMENILSAVSEQNWEQVAHHAHTLKGECANVGAHLCGEAAQALVACTVRNDPKGIAEAVERLQQVGQQTQEAGRACLKVSI